MFAKLTTLITEIRHRTMKSFTEENISERFANRAILKLTILIAAIFIFTPLVQEDMFVDGLTYAAISRNLALGIGSSSHVLFSTEFYGHPPLFFIIQSLFFSILGDHLYTERIFCLVLLFLNTFLIYQLWRIFISDNKFRFLPIFFYMLMPVVHWVYPNNMIDTLVSTFCMASTWSVVYILKKEHFSFPIFLFSVITFLGAIFTKGPIACFILAVPICYVFSFSKKLILGLSYSISLLLILILCITLLYKYSTYHHYMEMYWREQLYGSITNAESTNGRFQVFTYLFHQIWIPVSIISILYYVSKNTIGILNKFTYSKQFLFFSLVALCASIPILISQKQRVYYLLPSLHYYAIALALLFAPILNSILPFIKKYILIAVNRLLLVCITIVIFVCFYLFGKVGRATTLVSDMHEIEGKLPPFSNVCLDSTFIQDGYLQAYLQRYFGTHFQIENNCNSNYNIVPVNKKNALQAKGFNILNTNSKYFYLVQKTN